MRTTDNRRAVVCAVVMGVLGCASPRAVPRQPVGVTHRLPPGVAEASMNPAELPKSPLRKPSAPPTTRPEPDGRRLSLAEALRVAAAQNLDIAVARAREQVAQARVRIAHGAYYPELEASAAASTRDGRAQGNFGDIQDAAFETYEAAVSLVYRRNLLADIQDAAVAALDRDATLLQRTSVQQQVYLRVAEFYHSLVVANVGAHIARDLEQDNRRLLEIVEAREEAGIASGSETARARARLAASKQDAIDAQRIYDRASIRLAVMLRLPPDVPLLPREQEIAPRPFRSQGAWGSAAVLERHPDVAAATVRSEVAERRERAATWELLAPDVVVRVRQGYLSDDSRDFGGRTDIGGLVLWTFSEEKLARIAETSAQRKVDDLLTQRIEERVRGEILAAETNLRAQGVRIPLAQEQLAAAEQGFRISLARYQEGTGIALEVFESQDEMARARLGLATTIVDFNLSQVRLLAAAGALTPQAVEP